LIAPLSLEVPFYTRGKGIKSPFSAMPTPQCASERRCTSVYCQNQVNARISRMHTAFRGDCECLNLEDLSPLAAIGPDAMSVTRPWSIRIQNSLQFINSKCVILPNPVSNYKCNMYSLECSCQLIAGYPQIMDAIFPTHMLHVF
jgi:hypothetical protein